MISVTVNRHPCIDRFFVFLSARMEDTEKIEGGFVSESDGLSVRCGEDFLSKMSVSTSKSSSTRTSSSSSCSGLEHAWMSKIFFGEF